MRGMQLLPEHQAINVAYLWVDLAGHLVRAWNHVVVSTERLLKGPIPGNWKMPDVRSAIETWQKTDGLNAAMGDLGAMLRGEAQTARQPDVRMSDRWRMRRPSAERSR